MSEPIGVALVGAGWAGNRHAIGYRALPDRGRIVAVVDAKDADRDRIGLLMAGGKAA